MTDLEEKLKQNVNDAFKAEQEKAKRVPTPWRIGPLTTLREAGEQLGLQVLRGLPHGRDYALDAQGRIELAATAVSAMKLKANLTAVLEAYADVIPGWRQERPPEDGMPELPVDKTTGLRLRNPWLPLPPRPNETTPRYDHKSQHVIREQSPRLAKWLEECAENDGLPSAAMLDRYEAEKIENAHLRTVVYGEAQWNENLLRPGSDANLTQQNLFARSVTDPWLLQFHRQEAKAGSPRAKFDNLTVRMALHKRSPEAREVHRAAGEILPDTLRRLN